LTDSPINSVINFKNKFLVIGLWFENTWFLVIRFSLLDEIASLTESKCNERKGK